MRYFMFAAVLLLTPSIAAAQAYKWVDDKGRTQYSDTPPPPGVKFERLDNLAPPDPPAAAATERKDLSAEEMEFRKRQLEAAEKQKETDEKDAQARAKQEQCASARARLKILTDGGRLLKPNAEGDREYMGNEEIEAERVKSEKNVEALCSQE